MGRGLTGNVRHRTVTDGFTRLADVPQCSALLTSRVTDRESLVSSDMMDEREGGSEKDRLCCPRCSASDPRATLLTSMARYFACRRCEHRWQTAVKSKRSDDAEQERVMDESISVGDVIVCRVNGTSDLYVIGTVVGGTVGGLSLSAVSTMVGLARAIAQGHQDRTPDERVWLFDGTASGYIETTAPRSLLYP